MTSTRVLMAAALGLMLAACGDDGGGMMGPSTRGMGAGTMPGNAAATMLMSVSPAAGATGVPTTASAVLRFSGPMAMGMERYVDLHRGDLSGSVVPMGCALSSDRTVITCVPAAPLASRTPYTLHVGAGMIDASGRPVDMSNGMGGQWIMGGGGMMGSSHAGSPWGTMTGPWMGANGSYGMAFPFATE